ncbi:MAG: prepilin-type N-terminal cleavage/methylation domain-containing protein [Candidatus Methylacidiphilales bacterium]
MKKRGFTLAEMLVALGVLSILIMVLSQIFTTTSKVTLVLSKHLDADSQARLALDRISYDISQMIQRPDVDYYFPAAASDNGNDQMYFFSESSGYYPATGLTPAEPSGISTTSKLDPRSTVSLIGYRINTDTNQLERLSKGLVWSGVSGGSSLVYLPQTILGIWPSLATDKDYQVISDGIFRLQIQYLVQNATIASKISNVPNLQGILPGNTGYYNPREVKAIVISIAILDPSTQKTIPAGSLSIAANNLPSATAPALPLATWRSRQASLGIPEHASSHVRFYQRFCYLNPATAR